MAVGPIFPGDPKYTPLPDPRLTVSEAYALLNISAIPADSSYPLVIEARAKLQAVLAQQEYETTGGDLIREGSRQEERPRCSTCDDTREVEAFDDEGRSPIGLRPCPDCAPQKTGGWPERITLMLALHLAETAIQYFGAECPDYGEATESCNCLTCRTQMVISEWEDHPRNSVPVDTTFIPAPTGGDTE